MENKIKQLLFPEFVLFFISHAKNTKFQTNTKIDMRICIRTVSPSTFQISTQFCLKVPKIPESSNLGFDIETSIPDFACYSSPFTNLRVSWCSTINKLHEAYNDLENRDVRKLTYLVWQQGKRTNSWVFAPNSPTRSSREWNDALRFEQLHS